MLMFSALISLLTVSLALSSHRQQQEKRKRIFIYGFLGLCIGLALWVDFLIAPFVAMGGLLLFLFIWIRATLPRFRYDQLMRFAWLFLFPVAMANLLVTGFLVAFFTK